MCPVDTIVVDSLDFFDLRAACLSAVCSVPAMEVTANSQELRSVAAVLMRGSFGGTLRPWVPSDISVGNWPVVGFWLSAV